MIRNTSNTSVGATSGSGVVISRQVPPYFKGSVMARCIKQDFGPSKNTGKPMITLGWEIVVPEKHLSEFDGKTYDMTSLPLKNYFPLSETDKNGNPTDNISYLVNTLLPKLGLPAEFDDENPLKSDTNPNGLVFEGLIVEIYLSAKERKEQRQKPDGSYEDVLDLRGNPITRGWEFNMIDKKDILGLGDLTAGAK